MRRAYTIRCAIHPRYEGERKPKNNCNACWLIHILIKSSDPKSKLAKQAFNPFVYLRSNDLQEVCECIEIKPVFNNLRNELDAMVARMQTPKARAAMDAAFRATPEEMGKAAVKAARKRKKRKKRAS